MFENYSVSMDFLHSTSPRCLLLSGDASSAIMINEEDHLRIQCYTIGNQIKNAFIKANFLDDFIDKKLDYAFDNKLGFLTTCPTNLGTGLRASYMFHLPMLERSPVFHDLLPMLSKLGMTIRGLHGEGSDVYGSIYQISNQTTLGISESEIIENLESFAKQIVEQENQLRIYDMNLNRTAIEDKIFRSFGILSHCRTIEFREAMELISNIKLARFLGVDIPKFKSSLHNIIIKIQPGHLNLMAGKVLDKSECLRYRADVIRQEIK
jgi:protein arginine kinase